MRIAFFTDDYVPYVHGVTTSIQNYRHALEQLGHEVWVVAPKPKMKGFEEDDDHVIRLPSVNSYIFDKRPVSLLYPGIANRLDDYEFDIVHSQTQFYLGVIAGMVAKRKGVPHVTTVHTLWTEMMDDYPAMITAGLIAVTIGFPFVYKTKPILPLSRNEILNLSTYDATEIKKKQGWRLIAASVNQADAGITPSQHLARKLKRSGATVSLSVLPNGIPIDRYRNSKASDSPITKKRGEKFIVSVARISGEKRHKTLIDSLRYVSDPSVKLIIVGDGPLKATLEAHAAHHGLAERVIFTGMQSSKCVAALLKQADLFALASYRFDNQPMVILEAIASGLPIVYCDNHLKEGLTQENAILTKTKSARSFANAFTAILNDQQTCTAMQAASRKLGKQFDELFMAKQLVNLYDELIESHTPDTASSSRFSLRTALRENLTK